jgi:hypothetical protein
MKTIFALFILTIAAHSFASVLVYKWPSINGLSINNACATETEFRSLEAVKVCVETGAVSRTACRYAGESEQCRVLGPNEQPKIDETISEKTECIKYESKSVVVSRIQTNMKCAKWSVPAPGKIKECLKYETVTSMIGNIFNVETFQDYDAEGGQQFIGYTKYEIQSCK